MDLSIRHTTTYRYEKASRYALQHVRLRPLDGPAQQVMDWSLQIEGGQVEVSYTDHHGNLTDLVSVDPAATEVSITAAGTVRTRDTAGVHGFVYGVAPLWYFAQPTRMTMPGKSIRALSRMITTPDDPLSQLHDLSAAILEAQPYRQGVTENSTPAEAALQGGAGVCQDHAQIMISAARVAGLPARYVSGYLMLNDRVDQDASHGWAEIHLKTLGWVGFDVSNGISPDERYVRIATGRDAQGAAPAVGLRIGDPNSTEQMIVSVQVQQ